MALKNIFKLSQDFLSSTETPPQVGQVSDTPPVPTAQIPLPVQKVPVGQIDTFVNKGRKGSYLALKVTGPPDLIKKVNTQFIVGPNSWNEFRGKVTALVTPNNINQVQKEIDDVVKMYNLELNDRGLRYARSILLGEDYEKAQPTATVGTDDLIVPGDIDATMDNLAAKFRDFIKGVPAQERAKQIGIIVDQHLDQLASEVDEVKKEGFIKAFLEISSKLYNYSFGNQLLIFFQTKGRATKVQSYDKWKKVGRFVKKEGKEFGPISIWVPITKKLEDDTGQPRIDPETGEVVSRTFFTIGNVYDVVDTAPFSGKQLLSWQKRMQKKDQEETGKINTVDSYKPYEPSKREWWLSKGNKDTDETIMLRDASLRFAKSQGINIDLSKDTGRAGGWSEGGEVAINVESFGQRQLSTIIHELAHEILHWVVEREAQKKKVSKPTDMPTSRAEIETDAEATAYIVLKHFGFEELEYAVNYIALVKGTSDIVRKRRNAIQKSAKKIIEGIYDNLPKQVGASKKKNWYKSALRICKNTICR